MTILTPSELDRLDKLKISPEVGEYLKSRGIPLPTAPPLFKTPEPRPGPTCRFDGDKVDLVLQAFGVMRHTKGKWAKKPLKPDPWQVAYIIAPVFGWLELDEDEDVWVRVFRRVFVEVPRKNGKSTLLGGIGLYLTGADGEEGAEVIVAATTRDQASFVFAPIQTLVKNSPALQDRFRNVGSKIIHDRSGSYITAISSIADAQMGANVHGGIIDELHVHKNGKMVETIETGTGSRLQPLTVIITTADDATIDSIYDQRRTKIEAISRGQAVDTAQYGVIWCAEKGDNPFEEATWKKANPGYGISPTRRYLVDAAAAARSTPSELPGFLRLHLGLRTSQVTKYLDSSRWAACGQLWKDSDWYGKVVWGGLDLSTSTDLTAFVLKSGPLVHAMFWLPEERVKFLEKLTGRPIQKWADLGHLRLTEGNVVDYAKVRKDIVDELSRLEVGRVASIGYDPWNASETVQELDNLGYKVVPITQGYANLSAPSKRLEGLVEGSTPERPLMKHCGQPVLSWCADSLDVRTDDNGNVKPVKPARHKSSKRIDGMVALIMAMREEMLMEQDRSSAEDYLTAMGK
jgi:phage terminase large subunit-like protein